MSILAYIKIPKMSCSIKDATGIECPGCGIQRSIELLLNGHMLESIRMYPALIPLILTFVSLAVHVWKRKNFTLNLLLIFLTITVVAGFGHFIYKFF